MIMSVLSNPPLTPDQVILMRRDNLVTRNAKTLADLGIKTIALEDVLPMYNF